jgi:HAD superfamily hydrolase (TIGR01450 family)
VIEIPDLHVPDRLYGAYVFDLDGTIYLGEELLPGAKRLVEGLRGLNVPVRFLSNNPTKDPEQYAAKLRRLGLPTPIEEIVNTGVTMTRWLQDNAPDAVVYPVSEPPLVRALEAAGIRMSSDPAEIDIVIASYDRGFTYEKLQTAFDALWFHKRARLVATNPDRFCPFPGGRGEPDCAAIIAAIEACTGVRCEVDTGKPNPVMLEESLAGTGVEPRDCVMVGDGRAGPARLRPRPSRSAPAAQVLDGVRLEGGRPLTNGGEPISHLRMATGATLVEGCCQPVCQPPEYHQTAVAQRGGEVDGPAWLSMPMTR